MRTQRIIGWGRWKPGPWATIDWAHPLARGLFAFWLFAEKGGTVARDFVGMKDGVFAGGLVWHPEGVRHPSAGSYLSVSSFTPPSRYTMEAIVVSDVVDAAIRAVMRCQVSGGIPALYKWSDNTLAFYTDSPANTLKSTTIVTAQRVYHLFGTFDGATKRIYVNGRQENSSGYSTSPSGTAELRIGGDTYGQWWLGSTYLARWWSRALSSDEIFWLFHEPFAMLVPIITAPHLDAQLPPIPPEVVTPDMISMAMSSRWAGWYKSAAAAPAWTKRARGGGDLNDGQGAAE